LSDGGGGDQALSTRTVAHERASQGVPSGPDTSAPTPEQEIKQHADFLLKDLFYQVK
jgi:hypothetical protein